MEHRPTERRQRLPLKAMGENKYISRGENLMCRKEAILLDASRNVESFSSRENVSTASGGCRRSNNSNRIHPTAYHHSPYPRKKTILLFPENETVSVTSAAGSVTSSSSHCNETNEVEEDEARIRSSRLPSSSKYYLKMNLLERGGINFVDDDDVDVPHDEFFQDTYQDQEWKGACVAPTIVDEDDHDKEDTPILTSFIEDGLSRTRTRHYNESFRQQNSPAMRFTGTPIKATTKKSSNTSVVTPQTVSTSSSTAMEDLDALEDLFGCASPDDFLQAATDLAYEFSNAGVETEDPNEEDSVSRNSHDKDEDYTNEAFDYPEFLCHPTTDLNNDFEYITCPNGGESQPKNNNNEGMETIATDVHATPIPPTLKIMDNLDIPPLSDLCKAGDCVTRLFPPSSPDQALETNPNTVDGDTTKVDPTIIPNDDMVEPELVENPPKQKRRQVNRSVHQFLQNPRVEQRLNLYVDQYSTSVFDRIVENLYGNSALKTIKLSHGPVSMTQSESQRLFQDMCFLLEAIRCLPHLKTLIVSGLNSFLLPALMENLPSSLVTLDLQVLDETIPADMLDKLLVKKNLTDMQLEAQGSMDIGRLVKSGSRIKSLKVMGTSCTMDYVHVQFFADTLFKNRDCQLRLLDLQPTLHLPEWKALTACLRFNPQIQTLRVNVVGSTVEEQDEVALDLANFLKVNTTLTSLFNYSHDRLIVSGETLSGSFLEALQANTTLRKLRFFHEDPLFWVAKDAILHRNTEQGQYGKVFYTPYVSLTAMLPSIKSRLCGHS